MATALQTPVGPYFDGPGFHNSYVHNPDYNPQFASSVVQNIAGDFAPSLGGGWDRNFFHMRRPYIPERGPNAGKLCVTVNTGRWTVERGQRVPIRQQRRAFDLLSNGYQVPSMVFNAMSLRKEQWIELDRQVVKAYRARLRAWADLMASNSRGGFNAMAKMTIEYEAMSDPGIAVVDFDALTEGRTDAPLFQLRSMPLPIIHSDFHFSSRRLAISGNNGAEPLDTVMAEACARRIGEKVETMTIGTAAGPSYGYVSAGPTRHDATTGSQVYGYLTYPYRLTKTNITAPTTAGWHPNILVNEILTCLELLAANNLFGPFMVYNSTDWDKYLDNDYYILVTSGAANMSPSSTLRDRIRKIDKIQDVRRLDFMTPAAIAASNIVGTNPFTLLFVQQTSDVAQAVNGMDITTVQWETSGGLRQNFKIMCIQVPLIKADYAGRCGILQATTS